MLWNWIDMSRMLDYEVVISDFEQYLYSSPIL